MSSIDERVVQMRFEDAEFRRGVQQTLNALNQLNQALKLQGATQGFQEVAAASRQFDVNMSRNRDAMGRFTASMAQVTTATTQFDQNVGRNRDSLGRFTASVEQVSTSTNGFSQKIESSKEKIERFATGVSSAIQTFGEKINLGREHVNSFADKLNDIGKEADKQNGALKRIGDNVQNIASRFTKLGTVATGALMNIGARAQEAGMRMLNSFSFGPIMDGFREYELNINSIQTILANTQAAGTTLKDVTGALDQLNTYADQTIYNFAEMTRNIGTFTAAGVGLKESVAAIKGIANLAAISGSNSEQAAGAMYQLSQAIAANRVTLEDWNSVVNAGMGGTVFQRALAQTAVALGKLDKNAVKLDGAMKNVTVNGKSFRESISAENGKSWLDSEVLTKTLAQFTGDLKDADLAAMGFNKHQIKAIQEQAKMAKAAATEVKTLSHLFDTFKEQLGSGWAQTWQIIFGDFAEAKGLFTGISNSVGDMLQKSSDARNKMLQDWKSFGGRDALIKGITNVFQALVGVLKPVKDAFREIFPPTTGKQLAEMTKSFRDFTERLKIGSDTAEKLKRTFAGVFAIFGLAWDVIKGVVGVIFDLVGAASKGSGGILSFTAKIGDFLVAIRKGIKEGKGLTNFFKGLGDILAVPIKLVVKLGELLGKLFKDTDTKGVEKSVENLSAKLDPLGKIGEVVSKVWGKVLTVMKNVANVFRDLGDRISRVFEGLGLDISTMFSGLDYGKILAGINTGLFAGLVLMFKNFFDSFDDGPSGLLDKLSEGVENLTDAIGAMQDTLRAATLLQIAVAIGILAVSMNILSKIDADGLTRASAAMAGLFTQLIGALLVFEKLSSFKGFAKMPFVAASMILLSTAIVILAQAVEDLAALNWKELAKGLTGTVVLLAAVGGVTQLIKNPGGLISVGLGMIAIGAAIKILASAAKDMAALNWEEIGKGLLGVGTLLTSLAIFTRFGNINKAGLMQGAGIILLATGLKILASATKDFAKMSWDEIGRGLAALSGGLVLVAGALKLIPPTAPLAAAGILLTSLSLGMVADALKKMAKMSWSDIGKSLTTMLGVLTLITAALYVIPPTAPLGAAGIFTTVLALKQVSDVLKEMSQYSWEEIGKSMVMLAGTLGIISGALLLSSGALSGAAAIIVIAGALGILQPVLLSFSQMSWEEIGKGLLMLAGALTVIGVAGALLAPVVPAILGLGAGIALLGVGLAAAGAGTLLFATALTALAAAGGAAVAVVVGIVTGLIDLIPRFMKRVGEGLVEFAKVIEKSGPAITKALVVVIESLISAITTLTPKIVDALLRMLTMMLQKMSQYIPRMVDAGLKLLNGILRGISNNIGKVLDTATKVVVNFINGVGRNLPKVVDAGVKLIINFVNGVAKAIDRNSTALGQAGGRLGVAIVKGMAKGIMGGLGEIKNAAMSVARTALNSAKNYLGIHSPSKEFEKVGKFVVDGFRKGLDGNKEQINKAFSDLKTMISDARKAASEDVTKLEAKLKKLNSARKKDWGEIRKTKNELAQARKEVKATSAAYTELTKNLVNKKTELGKLADKYDQYTEKIKSAQEAYDNAVKTRDDYRKSITEQYSDMETPTGETQLTDYISNLKKQIEDTKQFSNVLQRLRAFGLNDETYKDLLTAGTSALPFMEQLLDSGKDGIAELNQLAKELDEAGGHLGKTASTSLYQAAVDSAKGFLDGLKKEQANIEKQMDKIADGMVKAIKKKLGIKSPSRVFMEIGEYSAEGLVKGVDKMSGVVENSATRAGSAAVEALRKSISGFSDLVSSDLDSKLVITPVLDLSSVRKDAAQVGRMFEAQPIKVDSAYSKAKYVASQYASNQTAREELATTPNLISYVQNNYSPKALSSAEIYRQTKNQLSTMKGALTT